MVSLWFAWPFIPSSVQWTRGLPIEVLPFAYKPVKVKLEALGGSADLRMAKSKAVSEPVGLFSPLPSLHHYHAICWDGET